MSNKLPLAAALTAALLGGCATLPEGPSVMALPGYGKSFDQFRVDSAVCMQFAREQIGGGNPNQTIERNTVNNAVAGTVLGAAIGAAAGGHQGAGVGAASGLALGTMVGSGIGQEAGYDEQRRYDNAYVQCMYAKGNQVPVSGHLQQIASPRHAAPPPPPPGTMRRSNVPPPPPGNPPPPPPDAR